MRLVVIRHAQSVRNAVFHGNRFYEDGQKKIGVPNHFISLSEKGKSQATACGHKLFHDKAKYGVPDLIIHSGFLRTKETAIIIKKEIEFCYQVNTNNFSIPLEQNHLLRERDAGYAFEMNKSETAHHFPFLESFWGFEGQWFATPPGGESLVKVMDRVALFLQILASRSAYSKKTIYAVSHGGTMRAFEMVIKKIPFDVADTTIIGQKNCGILAYEYKKGEWSPLHH